MPELLTVFSKTELNRAHDWARGMGLSRKDVEPTEDSVVCYDWCY